MEMNEQFELNIEKKRMDKKVKILEMEARERKAKKMPKRLKDQIKARTKALEAQFKPIKK